jgi:hypothetical protein
MNQTQQIQIPDFTPMLFRQRPRGLHVDVDAFQQSAQVPDSGWSIVEINIPGLNIRRPFPVTQAQPWISGTDFQARVANAVKKGAVKKSVKNAELNWLRQHHEEVLAYVGQWLLISGDTLLARSQSFADIRNAIAHNNISSPFVYYVPTAEESSFVIL